MAIRVMFVCTGNSARSQMAEGLARSMGQQRWEVFSAGLDPKGINPYAIRAMDEIGIDIRSQTSKPIDLDLMNTMDLIVTLCGDAHDRCPVTPPRIRKIHWPLPDPAQAVGTGSEILTAFRQVRDELSFRIRDLLETT